MTIWTPGSSKPSGQSTYSWLAASIGSDIQNGRLAEGERLPTHRELARALSVTVGTVTRAYAEARRRGFLRGEVGRGTFVRGRSAPRMEFGTRTVPEGVVDLSFNAPSLEASLEPMRSLFEELGTAEHTAESMRYQPVTATPRHRRAGVAWMAKLGAHVDEVEVVPTCGGQHAMLAALAAVAEPGDVVATESLVYPGLKSVAEFLHLRLVGCAMDSEGLVPDGLDQVLRRDAPKAIYTVPTLQNPTARIMSEGRRLAIVEIARRHEVPIIEDDIYGFFLESGPPPLVSLAPDATFYLTGLSKTVSPGLRIGYLRSPRAWTDRAARAVAATVITAPTPSCQVATRLVETGLADDVLRLRREECRTRRALTDEVLAEAIDPHSSGASIHCWMHLPVEWTSDAFVTAAHQRNIWIAPASYFAVGDSIPERGVRLSPGAIFDLDRLRGALEDLRALLHTPPAPQYASV